MSLAREECLLDMNRMEVISEHSILSAVANESKNQGLVLVI